MTALRRAGVVLTVSVVLAVVLWVVAEVAGKPTPIEMVPGIYQPALAGAERTVFLLAAGSVIWTAGWFAGRALGIGRTKRRR
jgi:hypothetical protein